MLIWLKRGGAALAACLLIAVSVGLGERGFNHVLDFRALERIPPTTIAGSVGGETQLRGLARFHDSQLSAPRTGAECVYYRYTIEREDTDSDGNRTWRTIRDESRAVDFALEDESGTALIRASRDKPTINWSAARKFQTREGDLRYTEWRIDPGDRLTIFGWFDPQPQPVLNFSSPGRYLPIVSSRTAGEERGSLGTFAILFLAGSIACLVFGAFAVIYALRIHRTLVFLLIVTAATTLLLVHYGFRSLERDVMDGAARLAEQRARTEALIETAVGTSFSGLDTVIDLDAAGNLSERERAQIKSWRQAAWIVRARYMQQIEGFPENSYALLRGVASPPPVALPVDELAEAQSRAASFEKTRTGFQLLFSGIGLVLVIVAAWLGFRAIRTKRMQENLTISKTAGVVYGMTEVEGKLVAEADVETLTAPLTGRPCVWFHYVVDEKRGSGKNAKWVRIEESLKKQPFYCEDDEGKIRVFPGHAEVITTHHHSERRGNRRYSEHRLEPLDTLYILGKAQIDRTSGDSLVLRHSKDSDYIIANESEAQVMFRKATRGMFSLAIGISILFFCALWIGGGNGNFSSLDFLLASLVAPAFLGIMLVILMYNDLVFLRSRCERNWANIQVSLKKRATLIPQLESVAKRFLEHEQDLLESLADMRTTRAEANTAPAVDKYMALEDSALTTLQAAMEDYPDLKGDQLAAELNRRMIKLENEVALIRAGFNDAVMQYRIRRQTFPDNLLARAFGFEDYRPLTFNPVIREVPAVTL